MSSVERGWSELVLRGDAAKSGIIEAAGGLLSLSDVAALLETSTAYVEERTQRRELLAVPLPGGELGFPATQFDAGLVRGGVGIVAEAGVRLDPWVLLSILTENLEDEQEGILLEGLDDAAVRDDVLSRLASYGEHVAT